jgi:hypothetical protein
VGGRERTEGHGTYRLALNELMICLRTIQQQARVSTSAQHRHAARHGTHQKVMTMRMGSWIRSKKTRMRLRRCTRSRGAGEAKLESAPLSSCVCGIWKRAPCACDFRASRWPAALADVGRTPPADAGRADLATSPSIFSSLVVAGETRLRRKSSRRGESGRKKTK